MTPPAIKFSLVLPCLVSSAAVVEYEGEVFPEEVGFEREIRYDPERWIDEGWLFQHVVARGNGGPFEGDNDSYRYSLSSFAELPFFVEWRVITDAPNSEVDGNNGGAILAVAGSGVNAPVVTYHFNMASGLARLLFGFPMPTLYFDIEPGVPHTYRLEVYGGDYFEFTIDGVVRASGLPEDAWPNSDASMIWGARYFQSAHTTQWDYIRFGTINIERIPTVSQWAMAITILLVLTAGTILLRRRTSPSTGRSTPYV